MSLFHWLRRTNVSVKVGGTCLCFVTKPVPKRKGATMLLVLRLLVHDNKCLLTHLFLWPFTSNVVSCYSATTVGFLKKFYFFVCEYCSYQVINAWRRSNDRIRMTKTNINKIKHKPHFNQPHSLNRLTRRNWSNIARCSTPQIASYRLATPWKRTTTSPSAAMFCVTVAGMTLWLWWRDASGGTLRNYVARYRYRNMSYSTPFAAHPTDRWGT